MTSVPAAWRAAPAFSVAPLAGLVLYTPLLATVLLAKVSLPPFAALSLSIAYLFIFLAVGMGVALGHLRVDSRRLGFFLVFIGSIGAVQVFRGDVFSLTSMLLLGSLLLAYVFTLPDQEKGSARALDFFLGLATVLALVGIAQFGVQMLLGPRLAFPIESFVPGEFLIQGFNAQALIAQGEVGYRVNGVFFSEPSFFSQFMAVAIVTEALTRSRLSRLALYTLALLLSYSGTGILVLAVCLPLIVLTRGATALPWQILAGLLLAVALFYQFGLEHLTGRIGEFSSFHSSAFARFISGFHLFDRYLWTDPVAALFGLGAGTYPGYAVRMPFPVAEMTLFKMVFEYGLLGAAGYFAFLGYCLFRADAPAIVRLAVALTLLLNGPYVPFFHGLALSLLVWPAPARDGVTRRGAGSAVPLAGV